MKTIWLPFAQNSRICILWNVCRKLKEYVIDFVLGMATLKKNILVINGLV